MVAYFVLSVVLGCATDDWAFTFVWIWSKSGDLIILLGKLSLPSIISLFEGEQGKCIILKDRYWGRQFQDHIQQAYILLWSGINAESLSKILVYILKNILGDSESKKLEEVAMKGK